MPYHTLTYRIVEDNSQCIAFIRFNFTYTMFHIYTIIALWTYSGLKSVVKISISPFFGFSTIALDWALGICCVNTNSPPVKSLSGSFKNKTVCIGKYISPCKSWCKVLKPALPYFNIRTVAFCCPFWWLCCYSSACFNGNCASICNALNHALAIGARCG